MVDFENFGDPCVHFEFSYLNIRNKWRHEFYIYYYEKTLHEYLNIDMLYFE